MRSSRIFLGLIGPFALAACSSSSPNDDGSAGAAGGGVGGTSGVPSVAGSAGSSTSTGGSGASAGGASGGSSGSAGSGANGGSGASGGDGPSGGSGAGALAGSAGSTAGSAGTGGTAGGGPSGGAGGSSGGGAGSGGSSGEPGTEGTPKEEALADLLAPRQEHAVVALAGEIYVIGGYVAGSGSGATAISASVQAYDPEEDSWREVQSVPVDLQHSNAGVIGEKLYVAGFYRTAGTTSTSDQLFEYDPAADEWTEKSALPAGTGRAAGCTAVDAGLFYVFGGAIDGTSVADVSRYDPASDEWETLPDLPAPREHCAAGAIGGTLYVTGGRVDEIDNIEPDTWAFDPGARAWTPVAPLPRARGGLAAAVLGGRLYTFGGEGNPELANGIFDDIAVYDPASDAWENLEPMLVPRHGFGAATLDGRIYLAGGAIREGGAASTENSVFYLE